MKISINWMLDHIATPITKLDVGLIAAKFNVHTAEIEHYEAFNLDIAHLFLCEVLFINSEFISVRCAELQQTLELPFRNDLHIGQLALMRRHDQQFQWEKLQRYNPVKEGLFPAVDCHATLVAGDWKKHCEDTDYILDVDNKSINHRPDLWGHRGVAREVAAFMGWQLKPLDQMLAKVEQLHADCKLKAGADHAVSVAIEDLAVCPRLAVLYCHDITHKSSQIWMAMRLARVDSKPINTIVDISNYVMFDIGQPMHVFDAATFINKNLEVRTAHKDEMLELLDGHRVQLSEQDIVITDGAYPVALAGVMGGKQASFTSTARSIVIEAGSFQAAMVRNSAARVKLSTEASTRFAKQLDPMQNTIALLRFVYLAQGLGVVGTIHEKIVSVGKIIQPSLITLTHSFIESRLGIQILPAQVIATLHKLEFAAVAEQDEVDIIYCVTVPTLRTTKDITLPEDIVEEIVRIYGFDNITYKRPIRHMKSFDMNAVMKLRKIKEYCAFSMNMREVRDYLFYDESFLKRLDWYPVDAVTIKNPVSENWKVLVTSLIPHLLKNVELNCHTYEQINLFEYNNIWHTSSDEQIQEIKSLAGVLVGHKNMNFYDYKAELQGLFTALNMPIRWVKSIGNLEPWFDQLQVADLILDGVKVGRAGMLSVAFIRPVFKLPGFIFELHADALIQYKPAVKQFKPWSKYQAVTVDISMLIDELLSAYEIEYMIAQVDTKIDQVQLLDYFEKAEWAGKRSLTFRYRICDFEQNLTKDTIEQITNKVIKTMENQGAAIR